MTLTQPWQMSDPDVVPIAAPVTLTEADAEWALRPVPTESSQPDHGFWTYKASRELVEIDHTGEEQQQVQLAL